MVDARANLVIQVSRGARWIRITLEVIGAGLLAIAEEMGDGADQVAVLHQHQGAPRLLDRASSTPQGEVIAQAEHIPMHLGSLIGIDPRDPRALSARRRCADGDVFIGNDPYTGGGTHLPDINLAAPVFADGALFGFVANIAHHADGSGRATRSIWDEGLRIPPIRLVEGGRLREDVMELLLLNFAPAARAPRRLPRAVRRQPARRRRAWRSWSRRYGLRHRARARCDELLAYGERKIRAAIAASPTASTAFEDWMDDDGVGGAADAPRGQHHGDGRPHRAGLQRAPAPQVPGDVNVVYLRASSPPSTTRSRPCSIPTSPPTAASTARSRSPRPRARSSTRSRRRRWRGGRRRASGSPIVILGALAQALPERVHRRQNGANSAWCSPATTRRRGSYYVYLETIGGGSGGTRRERRARRRPGAHHQHVEPAGGVSGDGVPAARRGIRAGRRARAAPGRFRGGLGIRRTIGCSGTRRRFLGTLERQRVAPFGLGGGDAGGCGALIQNADGAEARDLGSKIAGLRLRSGESVTIVTPGAGGYGRSAERDPALLARDVRDGKVR